MGCGRSAPSGRRMGRSTRAWAGKGSGGPGGKAGSGALGRVLGQGVGSLETQKSTEGAERAAGSRRPRRAAQPVDTRGRRASAQEPTHPGAGLRRAGGRARARTRRVSRGRASAVRRSRPGVLVSQTLPSLLPRPDSPSCTARCTRSARRSPTRWRSPRARPSWFWSAAARTGGWRRGRAVARRATCRPPTCAACR